MLEDIQNGLRHFAAGAKVWVLPPQWGDGGEKVMVVGRHRGSHGRSYTRMVVSRRHLTNFRVCGVYSPQLLHVMTKPLPKESDQRPGFWVSREHAEETVTWWQPPPTT